MNDRRDFVRVTFFLALATLLLCSMVIPAFGQDAAAPAPAQNTSPAGSHAAGPPGVHHAANSAPPRYSPQSSVASRTTVDTLAELKKRGKLRVGVSMIVPWAMHDKDGNLIGFEIDVAKKIARDLGVEVEFYPDEFRYLIPDLLDNRFDVIISNLSISTNRAMQVNFSARTIPPTSRSSPIANWPAASRPSRISTSPA